MTIRTNCAQAVSDYLVMPEPNQSKEMSQLTRICVVEDTLYLAEELKKGLLEVQDIELIRHFDNGEDAVKGILQDRPDIVVMDIGLPQMSGIECMMRIRMKAPEIQFMMFTVFETSESVFDSLKAGAFGYILKRDGVEGVVEAVRELRAGGSPMSRSIARKVLGSFQQPKGLLEKLSARELEVLNLLSKGLQYKEIAYQLNPQIDIGTVKQHIHRIYRKLQVNNRTEAINKYLGRDIG